jgi:predicted RNA-binding protein with PIN domain
MSRLFLIDGYNLLHQIPQFADSTEALESRRDRLLHKLVSLSALRGLKLQVVFDGPRPGGGVKLPGINVFFAAPTADHYIRAVIAQEPGRRDLVIVSSDQKDIGNFARISGIEWQTSQQFWEWLNSAGTASPGADKAKRDGSGAPPGWTPADDEALRRAFGAGDEDD